ncbi:MAG: 1-phosphofructokinase family hexose kinase [Rhodospirillaceae bacterium]|nr:1-phosphofructokinase family hexose kinase [Rhodospirillaceae bacterium]
MTAIMTVTPNPAIDVFTSVPALVPFTKLRCAEPLRDPGGGGINVARVIHRLRGDVAAIFPSGGSTGTLLSRLLLKEGVQILPIETQEETRQDVTVLESSTGRQYRFIMPGAALDTGEWKKCLDHVARAHPEPRFVVGSGSLPTEVPADFYARLCRIAGRAGARMVLDCSGEPLKAALTEGAYLIKPNLREFEELIGHALPSDADRIQAGRDLISRGACQLVALTLGSDGALLIARDSAFRAEGLPIKVSSVVGAGDSFLGGMVAALAKDDSIEEALRYGVAAGTAATFNAGTELCHLDETMRLVKHVVIRRCAEASTVA